MLRSRDRLASLAAQGLSRTLTQVEGDGAFARVEGRRALNFCSNDYLGLSRHPSVVEAAVAAARTMGSGSGSSRLVAGEYPLLQALEAELADFVGREAALVVGSGFAANLGVLASLPEPGEPLYSDALNHASIIDGCRLSRGRIQVLPHGDAAAAIAAMEAAPGAGWYVSESLFSMDGDAPPLGEVLAAARRLGVATVVDEAHALGILGPGGRGLCAGMDGAPGDPLPDVLIGTFGKALGSYGAFVAGSAELRSLLINVARPVVFSTAPAPPTIGAARAALRLVRAEAGHRERLLARADRLRGMLSGAGYDLRGSVAHIIPVVVGSPQGVMALAEALLEAGIFARGIRPPTVPEGSSRLRLTVTALHTDEHLDQLADALDRGCRALKLGPYEEG